MSKLKEETKPEEGSADGADKAAAAKSAPGPQAQQQQRLELDESDVHACYANFCRVNGTPEELIIDFGLNAQPFGAPEKPLKINQRLVLNYYTAKRLMAALHMSIQRHESAFGVLETNVQKRVLPAASRS